MVVIELQDVGKRYWLRHRVHDRKLTEILDGALRRSVELLGLSRKKPALTEPDRTESVANEEFWALRNVSLQIQAGEVVGLLGRNGAGKSTLLKLISWIMAPTTGRVGIRGRLGCLLEVGSGFHPELSGRENVFLNGAILGMSRREIRQKFDEIVSFAEVEAFLDTAVKHYSSGMFVRLAFAVAALMDPDILIIDEVLSIGDAAFQQKCQGVISSAVSRGCTCLIVSHHIPAITTLCNRAILLERGQVVADDVPANVLPIYLASAVSPADTPIIGSEPTVSP